MEDKMERFQAPIALLARLFLAYIFIIEGWGKIGEYAATSSYMEANGVSAALLPLVILTELGGGILVVAGFMTRYAAARARRVLSADSDAVPHRFQQL